MYPHLGIFVVSHSERTIKIFIDEIDGFFSIRIIYQDRDILHIHMDI